MTSNEAPSPNPNQEPPATTEPAAVESAAVAEYVVPGPVPDVAGLDIDHDLDRDTFGRVLEPRGAARLSLADGKWHQISPRYVWVQLISSGILLAIVLAAVLVLTVGLHQTWAWIPGGIVLLLLLWAMAITPRQARAYGFQLRHDDLVFRRGILWQRFVAVPYGRMQLVDVSHGPLDRGFGIAQLKLVTAAATTGVVIPGLAQSTAEELRDVLIEVAETRRTGL